MSSLIACVSMQVTSQLVAERSQLLRFLAACWRGTRSVAPCLPAGDGHKALCYGDSPTSCQRAFFGCSAAKLFRGQNTLSWLEKCPITDRRSVVKMGFSGNISITQNPSLLGRLGFSFSAWVAKSSPAYARKACRTRDSRPDAPPITNHRARRARFYTCVPRRSVRVPRAVVLRQAAYNRHRPHPARYVVS